MVNFYHHFIPGAAGITRGQKPTHEVDWSVEGYAAFTPAKVALATAAMLAHPLPDAPIAITTEASDCLVGAVLEQWVDGAWQTLAFFSHQLRPAKYRYSTFDQEL